MSTWTPETLGMVKRLRYAQIVPRSLPEAEREELLRREFLRAAEAELGVLVDRQDVTVDWLRWDWRHVRGEARWSPALPVRLEILGGAMDGQLFEMERPGPIRFMVPKVGPVMIEPEELGPEPVETEDLVIPGPWGWRELERRLLYRWQDARAN